MHCYINMYNTKAFYPFEWNNFTYLNYNKNCFNNNKCDFKVKIVVGM